MSDDVAVDEAEAAVRPALGYVRVALPHLVGLSHAVRIVADRRVPAAGVFDSGLMMVNPEWFLDLESVPARAFVLAHELLHLALDTHGRRGDHGLLEFNCAHDLIINDILEEELGMPPPGGGIRRRDARFASAEALVTEGDLPAVGDPFRPQPARPRTALARALADALGQTDDPAPPPSGPHCRLADELEREWFPDESEGGRIERRRLTQIAAREAVEVQHAQEEARKLVNLASDDHREPTWALHRAFRGQHRPPWQVTMHRWLEGVTEPRRSFARASRRGGDRQDVVLPGRINETWTVSVILDTSGSMTADEIGQGLGAIAEFGRGAGLTGVRIVQCDEEVTADETLAIEDLDRFRLVGRGGTDLDPAFEHVALDPEVRAAVVITDGGLYPPPRPPFEVLWVLTWPSDRFKPDYGAVLSIDAR